MFAYPPPGHYLLPTERRVIRIRRHWAILVPNVIVTTVVVVGSVVLSVLVSGAGSGVSFVHSVLWYVEVFALLRLAVVIADWWDDLIMVTDERVLNITGLIASDMTDTPISKITDRKIKHSFLGNLLGYGTVIIESAGHKSLQKLRFVPEPMTFYEAIVKLTSKKGLPPPASGEEQAGGQPSIEQQSAEWPVDE